MCGLKDQISMVSDMREWCNQYTDGCPTCKSSGIILLRNTSDPFGPELIPKYCSCKFGKKLLEKDSLPPRLSSIGWDTIWMNLAKDIATRSTCLIPNRQIGCVIVSNDNTKVLSIGYNGSAKGDDNSCDYDSDQKKMGDSRCTCVHAEMNALVKLDTSNPIGKKMYLTTSPCSLCYKLIVNAGIEEVIYVTEYSSTVLSSLKSLGVKVRSINETD